MGTTFYDLERQRAAEWSERMAKNDSPAHRALRARNNDRLKAEFSAAEERHFARISAGLSVAAGSAETGSYRAIRENLGLEYDVRAERIAALSIADAERIQAECDIT